MASNVKDPVKKRSGYDAKTPVVRDRERVAREAAQLRSGGAQAVREYRESMLRAGSPTVTDEELRRRYIEMRLGQSQPTGNKPLNVPRGVNAGNFWEMQDEEWRRRILFEMYLGDMMRRGGGGSSGSGLEETIL